MQRPTSRYFFQAKINLLFQLFATKQPQWKGSSHSLGFLKCSMLTKGLRIQMRQEGCLWGRLPHWDGVGGPSLPLQCPPPTHPTRQHAERRACLQLAACGPGGDSSSWPPARLAVAREEVFGGLWGICWPNSCSTGQWSMALRWDCCRRAQQGLGHSETRKQQMDTSSVPTGNKWK